MARKFPVRRPDWTPPEPLPERSHRHRTLKTPVAFLIVVGLRADSYRCPHTRRIVAWLVTADQNLPHLVEGVRQLGRGPRLYLHGVRPHVPHAPTVGHWLLLCRL